MDALYDLDEPNRWHVDELATEHGCRLLHHGAP